MGFDWENSRPARVEAIKGMIGQRVYVTALGDLNPAKIGYAGKYLPISEYGVALWLGDDPREVKGE
jgi:hypothetical protein